MVPDLESPMQTLGDVADTDTTNRVSVWRRILTAMFQKGYDQGYSDAMRDVGVAARLAEKEAKGAPLE